MLKIYDVQSMFQLNNEGKWIKCGDGGYTCKDSNDIQQERIVFNNFSWDQVVDFLKINHVDGFYNENTLFRKRPFIHIYFRSRESTLDLFENSIETISYKFVYTERENVSLEWIFKHLSADESILYCKQRGMQICPMIK